MHPDSSTSAAVNSAAGNKTNNENSRPVAVQAVNRLPCRGCTIACANYARCDGKPWRMD